VHKAHEGLHLSQGKYASDIIRCVEMVHCKPISTLLSTSRNLLIEQGNLLNAKDDINCRSIVGAL
jgi:hypothetical protein